MRRYLAGAALAYLAPLIIAMIVILAMPNVRHVLLRSVVELPQFVTYLIIRKSVISRDMVESVSWLNRQLSLSQYFKPGSNTMMPGVIANTKFVIERARLKDHYTPLVPYLIRLVSADPEIYISRIWLANVLAQTQPALALPHLEAAVKLVESDSRAYRIAIEANIALNRLEQAEKWRKRYHAAQFGGPKPHDYNTLFEGSGLRKLALEVHNENQAAILIGNTGLRLGLTRAYDFTLPNTVLTNSLKLHLGILPGIGIKISGIRLYGTRGNSSFPANSLIMLPLKGYFTESGWLISNAVDGDVVKLIFPSKKLREFDRVSLELRFARLETSRFKIGSE